MSTTNVTIYSGSGRILHKYKAKNLAWYGNGSFIVTTYKGDEIQVHMPSMIAESGCSTDIWGSVCQIPDYMDRYEVTLYDILGRKIKEWVSIGRPSIYQNYLMFRTDNHNVQTVGPYTIRPIRNEKPE